MAEVIYNQAEQREVDSIVGKLLGEMSVDEQQYFKALLQGYKAGVDVGKRLANDENETN